MRNTGSTGRPPKRGPDVALAHRATRDLERRLVRGQGVVEVAVGVRVAHVVEAGPEHAPADELLLDERFHLQRVAERPLASKVTSVRQP